MKSPTPQRPHRHQPSGDPALAAERPRLLDMDGAIAALATTRPTFYRWLRSGAISGVKVGRQWRFQAADIDRFLSGKGPRIDLPGDIKPLIAALERRLGKAAASIDGDPVKRAVSMMIAVAQAHNASDLHLSGYATKAGSPQLGVLQLRIDGALEEMSTFDIRLLPLLVGEWKRLAELSGDTGWEQGWISFAQGGKQSEVRVTVLPSTAGASLTASFFSPRTANTFDQYGLTARDQQLIESALKAPHGLFFFTGPVGSGKSNTLYAALSRETSPEVKVMTVEDVPSFPLPRTVSVRLNEESGLDYPTALRGCLNSDPDIIGIGDVKDRETMAMALECANSGHQVLACMHTNTALACLRRIIHLCGAEAMALDEIRLVSSQRLVRRLCSACAVAEAPASAILSKARALAAAGGIAARDLGKEWKSARGCDRCRGSGYAGRTPVIEILEMSQELRLGLSGSADDAALAAIAVRQGMTSLAADGIRRAARGETTLSELQRSIPDQIALE